MKEAYCFDLDGTITREEILPLLASELGIYEEISALTEATIKGVIPFRKSFLLRCRLLSELPISRVQEIIREINLYDELVRFIQERRQQCFVITGNIAAWVWPIQSVLGCKMYSSRARIENDHMVSVQHVIDKAEVVNEIRTSFTKIIAVGDGMGDVPMFQHSDVRIAFGGTHPPIQSLLQFTDYITFSEKSLCTLLNTQ